MVVVEQKDDIVNEYLKELRKSVIEQLPKQQ